jgi:shikimate kinase
MKTNITLIGMPGAGKSTVGIILAKVLSFGFIDTDILIQINRQKPLQDIMNETGYLNLRNIEENEVLKLNIDRHIIATGGSVVYSEKTMKHLKSISKIIFLDVDFDIIKKRIHNFDTRGIARAEHQTIEDLFVEREILYRKYAEYTVQSSYFNQDETAEEIKKILEL